ncbi:DUF3060 domain-containing protein [Deinococcus alpinitundrae]|uniref:DUF3060 domain-containing protein n=1 Tax=Deinococcus alpinitundrae TaxID=468913 RepID=UPI00137A3A84|nr:DUF3060 domain-containing protein [Deinococcus alpinitundrae]
MKKILALMLWFPALLGAQASAQSISIGPGGISVSGVPSPVRGQPPVSVQLDSGGLRITAPSPRTAAPTRGVTLVSRSVDCRGRSVTISGDNQRLTLTGSCASVILKGNRNTLQVSRVGSISIQGSGNRVLWTSAISGAKPLLRLSGSGNVVGSTRSVVAQPAIRPKPALPFKPVVQPKPIAPPRTATRL